MKTKQFRHIIFVLFFFTFSNVVSQTVYTTKSGKKYHKSSCRYLKYSRKQITIEKAKLTGYTACKVCKPTLANTNVTSEQKKQFVDSPKRKKTKKRKTASQCRGKTKSGKRCSNKTKNANKRCYLHQKSK